MNLRGDFKKSVKGWIPGRVLKEGDVWIPISSEHCLDWTDWPILTKFANRCPEIPNLNRCPRETLTQNDNFCFYLRVTIAFSTKLLYWVLGLIGVRGLNYHFSMGLKRLPILTSFVPKDVQMNNMLVRKYMFLFMGLFISCNICSFSDY